MSSSPAPAPSGVASSAAGAVEPTVGSTEFDARVPGFSIRLLGPRNARNIPTMKFIDDIAAFMKEEGCTTEELLQALTTMHGKYKLMEQGLLSSRQRVQSKQPDIERTLAAVERLIKARESGETMSTYFDLSDNVMAKAAIEPTEKVFLWLGAGVLVEYTLDEAQELLTKSLADVKSKEAQYNEDLTLVREQAITSEVNMSRTFNHDVKSRRPASGTTA
mmetsp:Transcript_32090/g.73778  ORF Transcript_32090/g.73778 Transcript_32090/m.73778 type:complete len:219 (+) Transcript_32090:28-684(+)